MENNEKVCKSLQVYKDIHKEVAKLAAWNDIKMKHLSSEIVKCMLKNHPEEIKEIIANLKLSKR